jgi:hypothetical protein
MRAIGKFRIECSNLTLPGKLAPEDDIYTDSHILPTRAADLISASRTMLLSGRQGNAWTMELLALLEDAERHVRAIGEHLERW